MKHLFIFLTVVLSASALKAADRVEDQLQCETFTFDACRDSEGEKIQFSDHDKYFQEGLRCRFRITRRYSPSGEILRLWRYVYPKERSKEGDLVLYSINEAKAFAENRRKQNSENQIEPCF